MLEEFKYENFTALNFFGNAYDAIWAMAVGLNNVEEWAKEKRNDSECDTLPGELVTLDKFNYTNRRMGCFMRKGMEAVNFTGITVNHYE